MVSLVLVENEFIVAEGIPSRLRAAGFDIIGTAATGKEVIAQARELHPDVVLMDVVLNGKMDGIEAAQQITERFDIPVVFLTAHPEGATVKGAAATTSYGFLVKPFDDLELRAAIEMAIRRHSIEAKTRERDGSMRELTESLSEVIFETDMVGNITFINRAGLMEFGYTKEQVEGRMTLYDFLPSDKHEEIRESIAQAVIDEPSEWIKVPGLRRDGSTFPVSVRASVIVREGVPVGIRGIALNVTEQNRAEQKLEESERRIRELTDALPEIIFETDADGMITFANATPFTRYGYTKGEIEGKLEFLDFVAPFDRERARETLRTRLHGEDKGWAEYALIKKDGSTAPFDVRTTPIVRDGVYEGLRGIAIDITERKRAEAALITSERRIRELTDALPVVVYEADTTGRITFVNATAFDLFGYSKEELTTDMSLFQLIVPADRKRARAVFRRRMSGKDVGRVEYAGLRKDGSTFNIVAHSTVMRRGVAVVGQRGVILDITELKQVEQWVKERTHTIEILNRIVTEGNRATDVRAFAEAATKLACELMHFAIGGIYLIDADARYATLQYGLGLPETARAAIENIPCRDAPFSAVLIDGAPLFAEDYVRFLPQHAPLGVASLASVPLFSQDTIIGALNVGSAIRHTFSQTEKELLVAIGHEVGTVIAKLQADEVLKESERRIRELTDALPVVVYEADTTGRISFVNATASELFGYAKEELEAGMSVFQLFTPADRRRSRAVFHQRLSGEDMGRVEYTALRKDGSTFPISVRAVPLRRKGIFGVRGIIVDITERRRTEQALAWEAAVNLAIAHLYIPLMAPTSSIADVALATLDAAKKLTGSGAGFVAHIDPENRDMVAYGRTQMILTKPSILNNEERAIPKKRRQIRYHIGSDGSYPALWGYALNTKTGFYSNAPGIHPAARNAPSGDTPLAQFLAVPALIGEEVVGQIALANPGRDYTDRDLKAIERLADVYALAIIRTRAEGRTKEDAYTIGGLNRIIAAGNRAESVQSFAETVTTLTLELMRLDAGTLHLVDDDARCANLRYATGIAETAADAIRTIPLDEAPYAALLAQGHSPQFFEDQEAPHAAVLGLASLAAVPLYSQDAYVGALNVGSFKRHAFSRAEKELLAAIGIEVGTVFAKLQADGWVRAALKEKETLLKEIHHRVKNNMQVVSSLLSLRADRETNDEAQAVLTASQSQIKSMALIHEKLYRSGSLAEINFADYVGSLIAELLRTYHVAPDAVKITTNIEDVHFGVDTAMPCALILNELVSNSLKHAFPDGGKGEITIGLQYAHRSCTMTVADDGVGFPADGDFRATGSLGLQLVTALVGQLDGTIDMNRENGTSFVISFSLPL